MSEGAISSTSIARDLVGSDVSGSNDLSLSQLGAQARGWHAAGESVVLCHGCFDILHFGHLLHLAEARDLGKRLAVTITADRYVNKGHGRPVFSEQQRAMMLLSLRFVDAVGIVECATAEPAIREVRPSVYVKGVDYQGEQGDPRLIAEVRLVRQFGGREHFTVSTKYSSTSLLKWVAR